MPGDKYKSLIYYYSNKQGNDIIHKIFYLAMKICICFIDFRRKKFHRQEREMNLK